MADTTLFLTLFFLLIAGLFMLIHNGTLSEIRKEIYGLKKQVVDFCILMIICILCLFYSYEYIGEFIYSLQCCFEKINVYSVPGNHSRISASKDEHLKGEELDELIPFCLGLKFMNNDKVEICNNPYQKYDNTISCFVTRGEKRFFIVHGDKDTPDNVVKNLTLMSGVKPNGIIMGHRHHNSLDSQHDVKIIQCGSLVGMDDYCVDKRISGEPEQCVFITSKNRTVKCLYDIGLN